MNAGEGDFVGSLIIKSNPADISMQSSQQSSASICSVRNQLRLFLFFVALPVKRIYKR